MRSLIYILVFFPMILLGQTIRYATATGSSSNGGTNDTSDAWDLQTGLSWGAPGRILYVKAGTYTGQYTIPSSAQGDANNVFKVIGYVTTPGDIDENAETTITEGGITVGRPTLFWGLNATYNASVSPLILRGIEQAGTALQVNAPYVHIYNFQTGLGEDGVSVDANYVTLKNIYTFDNTQDSAPRTDSWGRGIKVQGDYCTIFNVYMKDSGSNNLTIQGSYNTIDNAASFNTVRPNTTGYQILLRGGAAGTIFTGNTFTDIYVDREPLAEHQGHGIVFKGGDGVITGNTVQNFIVKHTYLEPSFPGVYGNEFLDGYMYVNRAAESDVRVGGTRIANNSHDNLFQNIVFDGCAIKFNDWDDGSSGEGANGAAGSAGYNNVFNQCIVKNFTYGVMFNIFNTALTDGSTYGNTLYNCTFYNLDYLFQVQRANTGTSFINCVVDNVSNLKLESGGYTLGTVTYSTSNFSNGFPAPSGTNITTLAPGFADAANGDFSVGANLQDLGIATPFLSANNDLGATQPGGTLPPGDVTAPTVSGFQIVSTLEDQIVVEWSLDEGGTGATDYDIDSGAPYANQSTTETSYLTYHRQTIRNLSPGTTYYLRVTGQDLAGNVYTSSEISGATLGTGNNPPGGVTASTRQKGSGVYLKTKKNQ